MADVLRELKQKNRQKFRKTDNSLKKIRIMAIETYDTWQFKTMPRSLQQIES